uniref:PX domain-containing protein n=1 Tax=Parascaris univalens TaxID=6257 RepID=A0A915AA86_PARUN
MALLDMNNVAPHLERNSIVSIPQYRIHESGKYATYVIKVSIDSFTWTVERRYREFEAFDLKRFEDRKKSFLPPKKLVGNMDPEFLNERRLELEKYIRAVVELDLWLQKRRRRFAMPTLIANFLDFHEYEVHSIVEDLSVRLGNLGDRWLHASASKPKYFEFTPIELHAITERMKLAEPTANGDVHADMANYVEFLHRVHNIKVRGMRGYVGTSNIVWNSLPFSLQLCKNLLALWVCDFDVRMISGLHTIRKTCRRLVVHYSMMKISDLLIRSESGAPLENLARWSCLEDADFSFNQLEQIDESVGLLEPVVRMDLSHNNLTDIGMHLQHLSFLCELDLSHNGIEHLDDWHIKLGNMKRLRLAGNCIRSLKGLSKLYSLEFLDLSDNSISTPEDVAAVGGLPCLEHIILRGNPVRQVVEYRTKVLESFGERAAEVRLDSRRADQREMDTVGVRLALKKAQREKEEQEKLKRLEIDRKIRFLSGDEPGVINTRSL